MRRLRDFGAELKALDDKARQLRQRRVVQLGELVIACRADALTLEELAGTLLAAIDAETAAKEVWARRGAGFFQRSARAPARGSDGLASGAAPNGSGKASG